jgi:RDD family
VGTLWHTARRVAGYVADVTVLAIVLVPIASLVSVALGTEGLAGLDVWLRSLVMISIPAWTYFVVTEHRWGAGVGKRLLGLRTVAVGTEAPPTLGAAFARTAVTLAPWELIHLAFFGLAPALGEVTASQIVVAAIAYLLVAAYVVVTLWTGGRRSPADLAAATEVRRREPAPA